LAGEDAAGEFGQSRVAGVGVFGIGLALEPPIGGVVDPGDGLGAVVSVVGGVGGADEEDEEGDCEGAGIELASALADAFFEGEGGAAFGAAGGGGGLKEEVELAFSAVRVVIDFSAAEGEGEGEEGEEGYGEEDEGFEVGRGDDCCEGNHLF